jgi:hypothetical protein
MFRLFKHSEHKQIGFCERCGSVCDPTCFAEESRQRAFDQLIRYGGWRVA